MYKNLILYINDDSSNSQTDLSNHYFLLYRFSLLGDASRLYLIKLGVLNYLIYYYLNKSNFSITNSYNDLYNKDSSFNFSSLKLIEPTNVELKTKLMNRVDRLSAFEELLEKKHAEKLTLCKFDYHLLMTLIELILFYKKHSKELVSTKINSNSIKVLEKYLNFNTNNINLVKVMLLNCRNKSVTLKMSKLINLISASNVEMTNLISQLLIEIMNGMDSYELEHIMRILKRFLVGIEDNLKETRVSINIDIIV